MPLLFCISSQLNSTVKREVKRHSGRNQLRLEATLAAERVTLQENSVRLRDISDGGMNYESELYK
jgi:IS30 family transposase